MELLSLLVLLLPSAAALGLVVFWAWMFRAMSRNDELPASSGALFEWPPVSKRGWTTLFILFSLPAAALYYQIVYRQR